MTNFAVIVTFSYDPQVSVLLFEEWADAMEFVKKDILEEYRIDIEENEFDSEYVIYEDEGRAVLTTHGNDSTFVTEWRIGDVFERPKEEIECL